MNLCHSLFRSKVAIEVNSVLHDMNYQAAKGRGQAKKKLKQNDIDNIIKMCQFYSCEAKFRSIKLVKNSNSQFVGKLDSKRVFAENLMKISSAIGIPPARSVVANESLPVRLYQALHPLIWKGQATNPRRIFKGVNWRGPNAVSTVLLDDLKRARTETHGWRRYQRR